MHKLPLETYAPILNVLCDGRSVRATACLAGSVARDADESLDDAARLVS